MTASTLPENFCHHSCLASRQWPLVPDKNIEKPPCQIPNSSSCLCAYTNNLKNWFLTASSFHQYFCHHSCLTSRQWPLVPDKNIEKPPCQIPNSSSCLCAYTNNLKNWFLTASSFHQYFCHHSCLASRQWSLVPDKNIEKPPCQIPNSSSCLCIASLLPVSFFSNPEVEHQLKEAENLYADRQLEEAKKKGEWVVKIDPDNERAKRLLGMIAYYQADYDTAYRFLKGLPPSTEETKEAQAAVELLKGDREKGLQALREVGARRLLNPEVHLRLAYGFLMEGQPIEALRWIETVQGHEGEVFAAWVFAAYSLNSWRETLELFERLSYPYDALDGYQGIVVDSLLALGDVKKAEERIEWLLKRPAQPSDANFTLYFQAFKRKCLDPWNRNFIAAHFFKEIYRDLNQAFFYFNRIEKGTPLIEIEKGETLMGVSRFEDAKEVFLEVLKTSFTKENAQEIQMRLYPLLGKTFSHLGFFEEAFPYYQKYYALSSSEDITYRTEFADVLIYLRRYDLALEQFAILSRNKKLSSQDLLKQILCLIHIGKAKEADLLAHEWLSTVSLSLKDRLSLARLMILSQNQELLEDILKSIPEPSQRTVDDNQQLIALWTDLGRYNEALELSQQLEKNLLKSASGSLILANLYVKLNKRDQALFFAEKGLQIDPGDLKIAAFIEKYEKSHSVLAQSAKLLKEQWEREPGNFSLMVQYAKNLIDLAIESYLAGSISKMQEASELKEAKALLERVQERNKGLPEVDFLLGKVAFLWDQNREAIQRYQKALTLDVSYIEARRHLALVFEEEGKTDKAIAEVQQAAIFDPGNSEVWEQLADLFILSKKNEEAFDALLRALRYAPFDEDLYLKLARLNLEMGRPEEAIQVLKALLIFSPENVEALKGMMRAFYDPVYEKRTQDHELLQRQRIEYYDRLRLLAPEAAKKSLPQGVSLEPEKK